MLTNKNRVPMIYITKTIGAASGLRIRCGKEVFYLRANNIRPKCPFAATQEAVPMDCSNTWVYFVFRNTKNHRRHTIPKTWSTPQTPSEAVTTLEQLTSLIQFVNDLSSMPTPPINEYSFSCDGFSGLYFFLGFIQDTVEDCVVAISKGGE